MAKKILVVDDEPELVEMLKFRLEANNYAVVTAFNGKQGLEKAKKEKPDLIILDIMMPEMDGTAMAQVLKEDAETRDMPIIFLTCLVEKGAVKQGSRMIGSNFFVAKPFDTEELLLMIEKAVSRKD